MTKPKFLTRKFIESAARFTLYFLAIALTPFLAEPIAPLFDWAAYGGLRDLFAMIFTAIFWGVEVSIFCILSKRFLHKKHPVEECGEEEECPHCKRKKKKKKEPCPPMPWKNLGILTAITVGSILITSAIIGFQVKPFYDMGEKFTGFEMWTAVGRIVLNAIKCIWVAFMLRNATVMAGEIIAAYQPDAKPWKKLFIASAILSLFAIFDICTGILVEPYGWTEWLLAIAYFLYYLSFPVVYHYAEEHLGKTYFVVVMTYIF